MGGRWRVLPFGSVMGYGLAAAVSLALAAFFMPASVCAQGMALPYESSVTKTGAARYSIPIAISPGTAGIAPPLALTYDSQAGNGLLGMGWQLEGLPSIGRCPRTVATDGVHGGVNFDANDRFCLDGQRLIAISGVYGADGTEYRTEIESFTKVISRGTAGTGPAWFEARAKSGQRMEFGNSVDSRIMQQSTATARAWTVNKVSDTKGNYFTVSYANSSSQTYPTRIDYTGNAAAGLTPYNSVRFVYQSRPDAVPTFLGGTSMRTTVRLTNLQIYADASLVSDYRLTYAQGTSTGRSQLTSLTLCGAGNVCLPATSFTWQQGNENADGGLSFTLYARGVSSPNPLPIDRGDLVGLTSTFVDLNGDGLADLFASSSYEGRAFINNGLSNGIVSFTQYDDLFSSGSGSLAAIGDWTGDGLPDVIFGNIRSDGTPDGVLTWYVNNGVANGELSFTLYARGVSSPNPLPIDRGDLVGLTSTFVDLNGDGLADLFASSAYEGRAFINNGLSNGIVSFTQYDDLFSSGSGSLAAIGDWTGDGLPDVIFGNIRSDGTPDGVLTWYVNNKTGPDLIKQFRSGFGATVSITYKPLTAAGVYTKDSGPNAAVAPMLDLAASHWVVSHVDQSDGIGGQRGWDYSYAGAKVDQQGRGFLGFRQRTVQDLRTGIASTSSHRQDYPFAGLVSGETSTLGQLVLSAISNSYGATNLGGTRRRAFLSQSVATRTDLDGTALPSVTTSYQYDAFGNATQVTAATSDGFSKTTTNIYSNDEINWLLGRLTKATAVSQTP